MGNFFSNESVFVQNGQPTVTMSGLSNKFQATYTGVVDSNGLPTLTLSANSVSSSLTIDNLPLNAVIKDTDGNVLGNGPNIYWKYKKSDIFGGATGNVSEYPEIFLESKSGTMGGGQAVYSSQLSWIAPIVSNDTDWTGVEFTLVYDPFSIEIDLFIHNYIQNFTYEVGFNSESGTLDELYWIQDLPDTVFIDEPSGTLSYEVAYFGNISCNTNWEYSDNDGSSWTTLTDQAMVSKLLAPTSMIYLPSGNTITRSNETGSITVSYDLQNQSDPAFHQFVVGRSYRVKAVTS